MTEGASERLSNHEFRAAVSARLEAHLPSAIELRHRIHADPRVSGNERDTALLVEEYLGPIATEWIEQGLVARLGAPDGPAIAIRAELDALPVAEASNVPWSSTSAVAHLCGHDVHLAALAAFVRALRDVGAPVPLLAVLQPREETLPCGAEDFIADEGLVRHDVSAFIGIHLQPRLPAGHFSAAPGPINASADEFTVRIDGEPAHGAYPHLSRDPIVAMSGVVGALQTLVSRRADPMVPSVVSVGRIEGGSSFNAIPRDATIKGTIRTFDEGFRAKLHTLVGDVADGVAAAHGCRATTEIGQGEPVLDNDPVLAARVTEALVGAGFLEAEPLRSCGADDFAFYGTVFPSVMVFAGTGSGAPDAPGLHHPSFVPDDSAVGQVAHMMFAVYASLCESTEMEQS